jgi:hypothetical protein
MFTEVARQRGFILGWTLRSVLRIPFRVSNRFGEPLGGALLQARLAREGADAQIHQSMTGADGRGLLLIAKPMGSGTLAIEFFASWTDPDGVLWSFPVDQTLTLVPVGVSGDVSPSIECSLGIYHRSFPQGMPVPEIGHVTRRALLATKQGRELHHAYEEARDSILMGLPNAAATLTGKGLESAIVLKGVERGWPTVDWLKARYNLATYLNDPRVRAEVEASFERGFYDLLAGAKTARILGAHHTGSHVHMDEAKALLRTLTQVVDTWFGEPAPGR